MKLPVRLRSPRSAAILLLSFCLLTSCDFYPENGTWSGEVRVVDEAEKRAYSCEAELKIFRSSQTVEADHLEIRCGSFYRQSLYWSSGRYERVGTDLYLHSMKVGDIYPDGTVRIEMANPAVFDNYPRKVDRLVLTWSHVGEALHFSLREESQGKVRSIDGRLARQRQEGFMVSGNST